MPLWSQALKVKLAVVPWMPSGTKRTRSLLRSSSAETVETVPTSCQLAPLSRLYCQVPRPAFRSVMAMPCSAPLSTSLTLPVMRLETAWPTLLMSVSVSPFNDGPLGINTGASLTLVTVRLKVVLTVLLVASVEVILILSTPTSPLPGVPENVPVAALKVNHPGRAEPSARLALKVNVSPSGSVKVPAGTVKLRLPFCAML